MADRLTFTHTLRRSFVLNGKRYTFNHPDPLPAGTYRLVKATPSSQDTDQ